MGPQHIAPLTFAALAGVALAIFLRLYGRRLRLSETINRRLGRLRNEGESLVRVDNGLVARVALESGLGWTEAQLLTRAGAVTTLGFLIGLALGSGAFGVVLALGGCVGLWIVVRQSRARRLAQCDLQMTRALEIMTLALRAGQALPGALALAASESPAPLAGELSRGCEELQLGRSMPDVLAAFGARMPGCQTIEGFVVAVNVLQETGGNLIAVLDRIVDAARARVGYQARLRALTAEGRQSARLLSLLPGGFLLFAMMSDRSYADLLLHDGGGRTILAISIGLWLGGIAWTRYLVRPTA